MSYCTDCIHYKVCGNEGVDDSAMTFCANKQTDGDLISRQAVLDIISDVMPIYSDNYHYILEQRVKDLPSAEKTAEWKDGYCSNCGCDVPAYIIDWKWQKDMSAKYCPNCGRRMLGEQTE